MEQRQFWELWKKWTDRIVLSVKFTNDIRLVAPSSDPAQPSIYELGEARPGDDIGNQMDGQNDEGDHVANGGRVTDVEVKEWCRHEGGGGQTI